MTSPFLRVPRSQWVASNAWAFALRDRYPVSPGHTLVIPHREVATWFDASPEERAALFELVDAVKRELDTGQPRPDGYNVGFNAGEAAGQTVFHLHVHVIPRYRGDMADPRGGVRHVIPDKGNYLKPTVNPLATGGPSDPFFSHLEPLFAQASDVAVLAAFVRDSGLADLHALVEAALARGARVRLLTGDYLAITQASALHRLLDWMEESAARRGDSEEPREFPRGTFEARVVESGKLGTSFHPKSWRFEGPGLAAAFVGSSNVSHAALWTGVEWNLRVERDENPRAWGEVVSAFEGWWDRALRFDAAWVERYAVRISVPDEEERPRPHPPHAVQREALLALARSRREGHQRALVVLATGLGKTLLAALDVAAFESERGRKARVLFLAHRAELLVQAAETFRRQLPDSRFGWCIAEQSSLAGDVVFASVQKLSRPEERAKLRAESFDYVIVDEVHHAVAASYRALLSQLTPEFLLGLTATPERADEGDVLGLFDDHLAYRADVGEGIARELLVPFAYHGLKDDVAYENIPWRHRRFDPERLAAAVQTEARMQRMWRAWEEHRASRTLVFCCSVAHARYVKDWLSQRGVRTAAVHSGPGTDDRAEALRGLAQGTLDAVCAVDLLNEGVDVPGVDRVVMLRPTESPIVFLQQLGRGLRKAPDKTSVTVIDFVGNHRLFLERMRVLLALADDSARLSLRDFLVKEQEPSLPPGCSVQVELEAKALLARLLPGGQTEVEQVYRELREAWGRRPTAGELYRLGHPPALLRGWSRFVRDEGDLSAAEARAVDAGLEWFEELETTAMSKSFKMVLLEALLEADALTSGLTVSDLAERGLALLRRSPELGKDLDGVKALGGTRTPEPKRFLAYWKDNPIRAWTAGRWFQVEGDRFVPRLPLQEDTRVAFVELTRELVDYRLAQYRNRSRAEVVPLPRRRMLVAFADLRAAAGAVTQSLAVEDAPEATRVELPVQVSGEDLFAVRASGDSMEGGKRPIRDGDWLVMRPARNAGVGSAEGAVVLVQVPDTAGQGYQVKRVVREHGRWSLRSDHPERASWDVTPDMRLIARLVEVIPPEQLAPAPGTRLTEEDLSSYFGTDTPPRSGRVQGHLLLSVTAKDVLTEPDRLQGNGDERRPGETAYVLTRPQAEETWRYAGVARWLDDEARWALPLPVDHATWRALGHGRGSSRRLPPEARQRAMQWAKALLEARPPGHMFEHEGRRCRLVGGAAQGGVRIDGGEGGFAERTVSVTDLAWALLAQEEARTTRGLLDETRVNHLRYLEGTPQGATRWIDTGWALYLIAQQEG